MVSSFDIINYLTPFLFQNLCLLVIKDLFYNIFRENEISIIHLGVCKICLLKCLLNFDLNFFSSGTGVRGEV